MWPLNSIYEGFLLNQSTTLSNNLIKYNHLIIEFLRMLKIALCQPPIWNIFSNEPLSSNPLKHCTPFPSRINALFFYCLRHIAACQCCGSWVPPDYLFYSTSTLWVLLCASVLFGSLEWLLMCWRWQKWVKRVLALTKQIPPYRIRQRCCCLFDVGLFTVTL